jgi:hypothetical protein
MNVKMSILHEIGELFLNGFREPSFLDGVIVVIKNYIQQILIVIGQRKMKGNQLKCKKCPKISSRKQFARLSKSIKK